MYNLKSRTMETTIIYINESLTLIQAVGGLFLFPEDWMKQKKVITKINDMQEIKTQSEIANTANYEINLFNT